LDRESGAPLPPTFNMTGMASPPGTRAESTLTNPLSGS